MQYKTVSYKRIKNLGNYETATIELFAELEPEDNVEQIIEELKKHVDLALGVQPLDRLKPEESKDNF